MVSCQMSMSGLSVIQSLLWHILRGEEKDIIAMVTNQGIDDGKNALMMVFIMGVKVISL